MAQTVVTMRVNPEVAAKLDGLALATGRTRSWHSARALERYVESEAEFLAFLQVGIDDLDAGRTVSQTFVEARLAEKRAQRDAQ